MTMSWDIYLLYSGRTMSLWWWMTWRTAAPRRRDGSWRHSPVLGDWPGSCSSSLRARRRQTVRDT
ncbi:hypothetical protein FKM82_023145 [Ascaphus truei]